MKRKELAIVLAGLVALAVLCAILIAPGFSKQGNAHIIDFSVSEDGSEMTISIGLFTSMGYVREVSEHQQQGGKLYLGDSAVLNVLGVEDQDVHVGIRPEGFIVDDNGPLVCGLSNLEVMGRDSSIVATSDASVNPIVRAIVDSDVKIDENAEEVRFSLKPHKVFLFNYETEERIPFEVN